MQQVFQDRARVGAPRIVRAHAVQANELEVAQAKPQRTLVDLPGALTFLCSIVQYLVTGAASWLRGRFCFLSEALEWYGSLFHAVEKGKPLVGFGLDFVAPEFELKAFFDANDSDAVYINFGPALGWCVALKSREDIEEILGPQSDNFSLTLPGS